MNTGKQETLKSRIHAIRILTNKLYSELGVEVNSVPDPSLKQGEIVQSPKDQLDYLSEILAEAAGRLEICTKLVLEILEEIK